MRSSNKSNGKSRGPRQVTLAAGGLCLLLLKSPVSLATCDYQKKLSELDKITLSTVMGQTQRVADSKDIFSPIGFIGNSGYVSPEQAEKDAAAAMKRVGALVEDYKGMASLIEESENLNTLINVAKENGNHVREDAFVESVPHLFSLASDVNQKLVAAKVPAKSMLEIAQRIIAENNKNTFCADGKDFYGLAQATDLVAGKFLPRFAVPAIDLEVPKAAPKAIVAKEQVAKEKPGHSNLVCLEYDGRVVGNPVAPKVATVAKLSKDVEKAVELQEAMLDHDHDDNLLLKSEKKKKKSLLSKIFGKSKKKSGAVYSEMEQDDFDDAL